jgi:hypothetical protein
MIPGAFCQEVFSIASRIGSSPSAEMPMPATGRERGLIKIILGFEWTTAGEFEPE